MPPGRLVSGASQPASTRARRCWRPRAGCAGDCPATSTSAIRSRPPAGRRCEVVARGVSALSPERESLVQELGLAGLQLWQSLSEATGRGRGEHRDGAAVHRSRRLLVVGAARPATRATLELLREVGSRVEAAVVNHHGRIVKRLGDGLMATFVDAAAAVDAALDAQEAVRARGGRRLPRRGCAPACTGAGRASSVATTSASTSTSPRGSPTPPRPIRCWSPTRLLARLDLDGLASAGASGCGRRGHRARPAHRPASPGIAASDRRGPSPPQVFPAIARFRASAVAGARQRGSVLR